MKDQEKSSSNILINTKYDNTIKCPYHPSMKLTKLKNKNTNT